jgi:hypothetical protein
MSGSQYKNEENRIQKELKWLAFGKKVGSQQASKDNGVREI